MKQLSWMSSRKIARRPPRSTVFEDGVEDREQLAHAGHQGYLLRFASRQQTLIEFPHYRVAACGDQSTHVQCRSNLSSTTPNTTTSTQSARVTVKRSDTYQGGHPLMGKRAQLRHFSQQRPS